MELRLQKEKEYHNKLFGEGLGRKNVAKYYSITQSSANLYKELLRCHCGNKKVLECGIGMGGYIKFLLECGANVTGIDLSESAIENAKKTFNNYPTYRVNFYLMNVETLEFENDSFDLICGTGILHHLDIEKAFKGIERTLKINGIVVFKEPLGYNPIINFYRKLTPLYRTEDEHPLIIKDLKIAESYFSKIDLYYFNLFSILSVLFNKTRHFKPVLNLLEQLDKFIFRLFPVMQKYAWQIIIVLYKQS